MEPSDRLSVVYLVCTNFCGSTLMGLLMDSHPQIASVGESPNRKVQKKGAEKYLCSCGEPLPDCPFWKQTIQGVNDQGLEFGVSNWTTTHKYLNRILHRTLTTYHSYPLAESVRSMATSMLPVHSARIRKVDRVCVAFVRSVLDLTGATVFLDCSKNLMHLYYLLRIPELDIRILRITRDVRAFVDSYKRRGRSIEMGAKRWVKYQLDADHVTREVPAERVCVMRYEDIFGNPDSALRSVCQFFGVESWKPPTTIVPKEHHVIGNRIRLKEALTLRLDEAWKTRLTEEEVSTAYRVAGDINERFGYVR